MRNNAETNLYSYKKNVQKRLQGIITTYYLTLKQHYDIYNNTYLVPGTKAWTFFFLHRLLSRSPFDE